MKYLHKYNENINFDDKDYKVIIVGLPSGEVFQTSYEDLSDLLSNGIVSYTPYPNTTGFYAFNDENREKVLDVIKPNRNKALKDILVKDNKFNKKMIDRLLYLLNDYLNDIEVTIEDYSLMISCENILIDIIYNDETSPKYLLMKRREGHIESKYKVPTDELLIRSILREIKE